MIDVRQTNEFKNWLQRLKDQNAYVRIVARIRRMEQGNAGDTKILGDGVMEMRIDFGPGYRVYFTRHARTIMILLCGGDKRTQKQDIKRAIELARELRERQ